MAIPEHVKRRKMDAVSHPETQTQMRLLRGNGLPNAGITPANPALLESRGLIPQEVKRMAMSAISSVETVAQVGWIKMTGGIAVYAARIREADREVQRDSAPRNFHKAQIKGNYFEKE